MTVIAIDRLKDKYVIEANGHSGYAEAGKDIVCAAISTLMCTLEIYLSQNEIEYKSDRNNGFMHLEIKKSEKIESVISFVITGFVALQEQYCENIFIKWGIK